MGDNSRPLVSICCVTYNHVHYIRDAIEGILMQESDFPVEIIIHDDCSTDGTAEIVQEYQRQHPTLITAILQQENQWSQGKRIISIVLKEALGKYVALCDGDDYWTNPYKLQKQVDYMESHPECRLCFHPTQIIYADKLSSKGRMVAPPAGHQVNLENWLKYRSRYSTYIATSSILFRRPSQSLPTWFSCLRAAGDWPLIVWLMQDGGDMGFLDENPPMSVYRKHAGGVTAFQADDGNQKRINYLAKDLNDHLVVSENLSKKHRTLLRKRLFFIHAKMAEVYLEMDNFDAAKHHLRQSISCAPKFSTSIVRRIAKQFIKCYAPRFYPSLIQAKRRLKKTQFRT